MAAGPRVSRVTGKYETCDRVSRGPRMRPVRLYRSEPDVFPRLSRYAGPGAGARPPPRL